MISKTLLAPPPPNTHTQLRTITRTDCGPNCLRFVAPEGYVPSTRVCWPPTRTHNKQTHRGRDGNRRKYLHPRTHTPTQIHKHAHAQTVARIASASSPPRDMSPPPACAGGAQGSPTPPTHTHNNQTHRGRDTHANTCIRARIHPHKYTNTHANRLWPELPPLRRPRGICPPPFACAGHPHVHTTNRHAEGETHAKHLHPRTHTPTQIHEHTHTHRLRAKLPPLRRPRGICPPPPARAGHPHVHTEGEIQT